MYIEMVSLKLKRKLYKSKEITKHSDLCVAHPCVCFLLYFVFLFARVRAAATQSPEFQAALFSCYNIICAVM